MQHYLNNAGAGTMSAQTYNIICKHLNKEIELGAYHAAQVTKTSYNEFYDRAAQLLNAANPNEIAFMDSASRAWNMALHGSKLGKEDTIVTLSSEFGTNLITLFDFAQRVGAKVSIVKCSETGDFDIADIEKALQKGAKILAISHAAAHAAIVNPVYELGVLAQQYGAVYIVDGCQAVGQIPIDVKRMRCDAYTATGRKWLCGPRGTGFLYIRSGSSFVAPQLDLAAANLLIGPDATVEGVSIRNDARQFELWERSIAGMYGLSSALEQYLVQDRNTLSNQIKAHASRIRQAVVNNRAFCMLGPHESDSGIVGFYLFNPSLEKSLKDCFDSANIGLSVMGDWDCPLHFPRNGANSIFRLSPHYYTHENSVSAVCDLLASFKNNGECD